MGSGSFKVTRRILPEIRCRAEQEGDQGHPGSVRPQLACGRPAALRAQEVRWTRSPCHIPEVIPLRTLLCVYSGILLLCLTSSSSTEEIYAVLCKKKKKKKKPLFFKKKKKKKKKS